jgi:hypothetical protein
MQKFMWLSGVADGVGARYAFCCRAAQESADAEQRGRNCHNRGDCP